MHQFTRSDLRHIEETRDSLQEGCSHHEDCDCCFSETVMLSFGYYEVYAFIDEDDVETFSEVDNGTY